ncbi:hypothetical protein ABPG74_008324 [Tetrahymena malaccensis]
MVFGEKLIKEFDLFSRPFAFFVGSQKSRTTFIGGFLSLSIICVSLVYFYYIMNLYFSNKIEPKITQSMKIESDLRQIQINESFFMMEMLINGQPLKQYEKQVNKVFLNYNVYYEQYFQNGSSNFTSVILTQCTDPQFTGYQCFDKSSFQYNMDIYNNPLHNISSDYSIQITPCDNSTVSNCATLDEINNLIFQPSNYFQIYTKIRQYDSQERKYKDSYKSEYFYFDPGMITYTRFDLFAATTSVTEGLIVQSTKIQNNIYDYQRIDTYFTQTGIQQRMNISGLAYIVYELNQAHNYITIQHAMITEVLAQFMSIFNSLLTIGILARLLAESYIVEDMNNILLKEYYKKTALRLVQRKEIKKSLVKFGKADIGNKGQIFSSLNIIGKIPSQREVSAEQQKSKIILEVQKKINETNFSEKQRQYFSISFFERIRLFIKKIVGHNSKIETKKDANSDPILYSSLLKQSMKRINIFEVYKDLIKMKMAIKLMLTKDQFAAIQFCGSDICQEESYLQEQNKQVEQFIVNNKEQTKSDQVIPISSNENKLNKHLIPSHQSQSNARNYSAFFKEKNNDDTEKQKNQPIETIKESNNEQSKQIQSENQIALDQFQDQKNLFNSGVILGDQSQKNGKETNFFTSRNLISKINSENTIQLNSPTKFNLSLQDRDNIQSLKINGDQNGLIAISNVSLDCSIEENQIKKQPDQNKGNDIQVQLLQIKSHLDDMDMIEESEEQQEKYLKEFLAKMKDQNQQISFVDKQIYQSLIINEQQVKMIEHLCDLQNNTERKISIDQPGLSKMLTELQQNQQKNNQYNFN